MRISDWSSDVCSSDLVMAAYNAGPVPVGRWNYEVHDNGDPLLFIESIPYYETRAYVTIVMRNYWMYQKQAGEETSSLSSLAQSLWQSFPGLNGEQLGSTSCRARVCRYVWISVVAVS